MPKTGNRLRVWIPDADLWLHEELDHYAALREEQGVPFTKSKAALEILRRFFRAKENNQTP